MDELRRVLDLYCFRLTSDQWRKIKAGLYIGPDNCVDYAAFLRDNVGTEVRLLIAAVISCLRGQVQVK